LTKKAGNTVTLKSSTLSFIKTVGGFKIARKLTANGLQILCFHGISLKDEHTVFPKLFITKEQFQQRLEWLKQHSFNVISLAEALEKLQKNTLLKNSVVITFDDGWHGLQPYAIPQLESCAFPATLYSTTYYSKKGGMVFNIALRYILEKSPREAVDLSCLGEPFQKTISLSLKENHAYLNQKINELAKADMTAAERQQLLKDISSAVEVDFDEMASLRMFTLLTMDELKEAADHNLDIQLHTHRHQTVDAGASMLRQEICDNRTALEPYVHSPLTHFCYPKGITNKEILSTLKESGITSAVTCDPGFNHPESNPLLLSRFLDGANISSQTFEAEMSGVLEIARQLRKLNNL
jgi:hypothetical protein